ncbi:MAG: OB-fold domain-containing protein [Novosphingobium sp.]|nr:OB-fold domain-containing protein [Novosphingobium sp.]
MTGHILPVPDEMSAPYWDACSRHELKLAHCSQCAKVTHPPDVTCPNCHSIEPDFVWKQVSGHGRVRSWTVIRQSFLSGFELPFLLVDVELDDHPDVRLIGRLIDGADTPLTLGDAVTLTFDDLAPGVAVPAFVMAGKS